VNHPARDDINLLDGQFYVDPHETFQWMRENAPIYWDAECGLWGVTRHEDIMSVSKNMPIFCSGGHTEKIASSRPHSPPIPSMINMDDPLHKRRRSLVNRGFTPRMVSAQEDKIRRICGELIDAVVEKGECEFVRDIAAPLPLIVIGDMLGVKPEDRDDLLRWSDDMLKALSSTVTPELREKANIAGEEYSRYCMQVVADRRSEPLRDDLMSILVHSELDGEKLDDEALRMESLLILVGGDETTRHVISGGMRALIENPAEHRKLIDDPGKLKRAVEEMLRWVTPIQNMCRTATRDVEVNGQQIREGDQLLLLYPSGNRDAEVFSDPYRFDIERSPNDHVAFGGYGTHFCLGAPLARLELKVMFEELLRRLPDIELASDEPLTIRPSNFIVGIEEMPVRFPPRSPEAAAA
jgi:cytochrome P450 family 142 subfamily A polypeptide 1